MLHPTPNAHGSVCAVVQLSWLRCAARVGTCERLRVWVAHDGLCVRPFPPLDHRENLRWCYRREGVNHLENCKDEVAAYVARITVPEFGMLKGP